MSLQLPPLYTRQMKRLAVGVIVAELIAAEGSANRKVVGAATVSSAIVAVTALLAPASDDGVYINDELVCQEVCLVVAEIRSLGIEVNLLSRVLLLLRIG